MIAGIILTVLFYIYLCLDGGGCYDPDPSADERYKLYQRQKRKEFWLKVRNSFRKTA